MCEYCVHQYQHIQKHEFFTSLLHFKIPGPQTVSHMSGRDEIDVIRSQHRTMEWTMEKYDEQFVSMTLDCTAILDQANFYMPPPPPPQ